MSYQPGADAERLRRELESEGWLVFVLPEAMTDGWEFIRGAKGTLPLEPPLLSDDNWNALGDSLWEGLYESGNDRIAIVWPESQVLAQGDRESFENAHAVFSLVAETLSDPKATIGQPKTLTVVLT